MPPGNLEAVGEPLGEDEAAAITAALAAIEAVEDRALRDRVAAIAAAAVVALAAALDNAEREEADDLEDSVAAEAAIARRLTSDWARTAASASALALAAASSSFFRLSAAACRAAEASVSRIDLLYLRRIVSRRWAKSMGPTSIFRRLARPDDSSCCLAADERVLPAYGIRLRSAVEDDEDAADVRPRRDAEVVGAFADETGCLGRELRSGGESFGGGAAI